MRNPETTSDLELQVSATVERLRLERRLRPEMLCAVAGFSRASYYVRMTTGGWRLAELEQIANVLDVPLTDLLTSVSSSAWTHRSAGRHLRLVVAA